MSDSDSERMEHFAAAPGPDSEGFRLLRLAIPVLCEQLLIYGVALFDTFLAGRINTTATVSIGLAAYVGWLATLMFALAVTGTTALVARSWGAGERERANEFFNQSIPLAMLLGMFAFVVLYNAAPLLVDLQNQHGETREVIIRFLRIDAFGYMFTSVSIAGAAALRGTGDMRSPMLILAFVNLTNVIASTTLVYGLGPFPALGINGIVGGTLFARICGGLVMLALLSRGLNGLKLRRDEMRLRIEHVRRILRIGVPAGMDGGLTWTCYFLFTMIIARVADGTVGEATLAAHVIGIQIEALTYLPAVAWGTASATSAGQALGAGDVPRARRVGHLAVLQCSVLACCASLAYLFGANTIFGWMHKDPLVREIGVPALKLLSFFQLPLVITIVYTYTLRGVGDTRFPMLFTFCGMFCVRLPLAYLCGIQLHGGLIGAWIGMFADVAIRACLAALRYARGGWVHIKV